MCCFGFLVCFFLFVRVFYFIVVSVNLLYSEWFGLLWKLYGIMFKIIVCILFLILWFVCRNMMEVMKWVIGWIKEVWYVCELVEGVYYGGYFDLVEERNGCIL